MKRYSIVLFCLLNAAASDDFESYKKEITQEYALYYEKEMKAFKSFVETSDGIPNKINPYQHLNIIPPPPQAVPKVPQKVSPPLPQSTVEPIKAPITVLPVPQSPKPSVAPFPTPQKVEEKVIVKPKNTLPEGTPSGSQIKTVKLEEIDVKKLVKVEPTPIAKAPSVISPSFISLSFFGTSMPIELEHIAFTRTLNPKGELSTLAQTIHTKNPPLIQKIQSFKEEYALNDWDTVILVQTLMNTLYPQKEQKIKTLHAVDLIRGLGYKVLLGEGEDKKLYFLLPTLQQLYSKSYITRENTKYYIFSINDHPRADFKTAIQFYTSEYDHQGSLIDMGMKKDPKLGSDLQNVVLKWDFEKKNYSMQLSVNKNLTGLMDMYPQVDNEIYMQSRSGESLITQMSGQLKKEILRNNLSKEEAVAFILRFSQQAFTYKTDFDAYGFERPLFAEQTVLLPYSDCEDRATLLSQLYRSTLNLDTVGLKYPGHISLGVAYKGAGDYYKYGNTDFFVADGTYFYANPGMSQPSFKNKPAIFLKTK